jgi:hypothetical protein
MLIIGGDLEVKINNFVFKKLFVVNALLFSSDPDDTFIHKPVFMIRSRNAVHFLVVFLPPDWPHVHILLISPRQIHAQPTLSSIISVSYVTREFDYKGMGQTGQFVNQTVGRT